jgi:hypothetical protein
MASQLEIINKALGHIGIAPIVSMVEASPPAQLATRIWDTCRQEVLKGHDWSFATAVVSLSTATYTILDNTWMYAYQYPTSSSCLEVWHVYYLANDKSQDFRVMYDPVGKQKIIMSNVTDAKGEFTVDITDTTFYDANFVSVLAYFLAANMAKPLTGDSQLAETLLKTYNAYMSDAERMNSYENDSVTPPSSTFVDARAGATYNSEDHYIAVRHPNG